jgi:hypothetical protein
MNSRVISKLGTFVLSAVCGVSSFASNIAVAPDGGFWVQATQRTIALDGAPGLQTSHMPVTSSRFPVRMVIGW